MAIDFSDLGSVEVPSNTGIDFSDLGGTSVPSAPIAKTTPTGFPEPQSSDNPLAGAEKPFEQRLAENIVKYGNNFFGPMAGGILTNKAINGIGSLFEAAPTLLNAGIKPTTILKMTPAGTNPAEFGQLLEQSLNKVGAIGQDEKTTWNNFTTLVNNAGQRVGNSLNSISKVAGPDALTVNGGEALQPLVDDWAERAGGSLAGTRRLAKPFEDAYQSLIQKAASNGGRLSLDDIHSTLQEVGPLTHTGSDASQAAYSDLYGSLANVRDGMVKSVAQQANNPSLAQNLLDANADYSKYMRLMPDVSKAAAAAPIKAGVSTVGKVLPIIEKGLATGAGIGGAYSVANRLLGNGQSQ
jgi:hypothetical protein